MPLNFLLLAASWTTGITGVSLLVLAASTFDEHVDIIKSAVGILLLLVAFWLRDWKVKRETHEKLVIDKLSVQDSRITAMETGNAFLLREIQQLSEDARRLHRWLYTLFPPEELSGE